MTRVPHRYDVEERAACILLLQERARGRGKQERFFALFFPFFSVVEKRGSDKTGWARASFFSLGPSAPAATPHLPSPARIASSSEEEAIRILYVRSRPCDARRKARFFGYAFLST